MNSLHEDLGKLLCTDSGQMILLLKSISFFLKKIETITLIIVNYSYKYLFIYCAKVSVRRVQSGAVIQVRYIGWTEFSSECKHIRTIDLHPF